MGLNLVSFDKEGAMRQMVRKTEPVVTNLCGMAVALHTEIVSDWEHKPVFLAQQERMYGGSTRGMVLLTGQAESVQIWMYVNYGTGEQAGRSAYEITPKKPGGILAFFNMYTPKTTPGGGFGGPGARSGKLVLTRSVTHKGVKPRRFDLQVKRRILRSISEQGLTRR